MYAQKVEVQQDELEKRSFTFRISAARLISSATKIRPKYTSSARVYGMHVCYMLYACLGLLSTLNLLGFRGIGP